MNNNHMEPLVLEADYEPAEEMPREVPLDGTTEWSGVIEKKRAVTRQQEEEERLKVVREREQERLRAEKAADDKRVQSAAEQEHKAVKRHRNKIVICLAGIVLMLLLSGGSFCLQYAGYINFPWSIVVTGVFGAVAAFFGGIVWEMARK